MEISVHSEGLLTPITSPRPQAGGQTRNQDGQLLSKINIFILITFLLIIAILAGISIYGFYSLKRNTEIYASFLADSNAVIHQAYISTIDRIA